MAFKMKRPMFAGTAAHKAALKSTRARHLAEGTDPDHGKGHDVDGRDIVDSGKGGKGKDKTTLFVNERKDGEKRKGDDEVRRMVEEGTKLKDNKAPDMTGPDRKNDGTTRTAPKSDYDKAKEKDKDIDKYIRIRDDENASEEERADAQDKINEAYGKGPTDRGDKVRKKKEEEKKADSSKPTEKADTSKDTKTDKIAKGEKPEGTEKASGRMKPGDPGYMKLPESEKLKIQRAAKARHQKALDAWRKGGKEGKRPKRKDYY